MNFGCPYIKLEVKIMASLKYKNVIPKKYNLEEVIKANPEYLLRLLKKDLEKKPLKSGAQCRINSLRTISEFLETLNHKIDDLQNLVLEVRK
jgi:hypothetical protein